MAYEKLLNEIYAAVSLKYLWKEYEPYFVKSDLNCSLKFDELHKYKCTQNNFLKLVKHNFAAMCKK